MSEERIWTHIKKNRKNILDTVEALKKASLREESVKDVRYNILEILSLVKTLTTNKSRYEVDPTGLGVLKDLLRAGKEALPYLKYSYYGYDLKGLLQTMLSQLETYLKEISYDEERKKNLYGSDYQKYLPPKIKFEGLSRNEQNKMLLELSQKISEEITNKEAQELNKTTNLDELADYIIRSRSLEKERIRTLCALLKEGID